MTLDALDPVDLHVGERLRNRRQKLNMTLSDLANRLSISYQQIQKYEHGHNRIPASTLYRLTQILGTDADYFFKGFMPSPIQDNQIRENIPQNRTKPLTILLIEDDPVDSTLIQKIIHSCSIATNIISAYDADQAMLCLRNQGSYAAIARPEIILLDLHLPKTDGKIFLQELKRDRLLCDIPVIILTSNIRMQDMTALYQNHAAGYVVKSPNFDHLETTLHQVIRYWAHAVALPHMD